MEKNIIFPTDRRLYFKALKILVQQAKACGIILRQTYSRKAIQAFVWSGRYLHARQMKRAKQELKKLKNYLGRVIRDIERRTQDKAPFQTLLDLAKKILNQQKKDSNKIYSFHEPAVECICKGKAHKKYEFGCKVAFVMTQKEGVLLSTSALHGNPYDGHILETAIKEAEQNSRRLIIFIKKSVKNFKNRLIKSEKLDFLRTDYAMLFSCIQFICLRKFFFGPKIW